MHRYIYKIFTFILIMFIHWNGFAQNKTVSGIVKDATGKGLPGVSILVKGTTRGTTSDVDGNFSINVDQSELVLTFSFIGFKSQSIDVGSQSNITVTMEEDLQTLSEVVVVGYGTVKKSDVTGSVVTVTPRKLQELITIDVNTALQGRVAGVQVINNSGAPGSGSTVRIRGIGSTNGSDPLYVVDGFPTSDISFLAPSDIESMEVLKDASAAAIYGNRGANGVIIITTKKGKAGTPTFSFNAYGGIQNPVKKLDLLNAHDYSTLYLEAWTNDGKNPADPAVMDPQRYAMLNYVIDNNLKGTDWQKEVTRRNAPIQNYAFDLSGGSDKNKYRFSTNYFNQQGTVKNTDLSKIFVKLNDDFQLSSKIKAGIAVSYLRAKKGNYNADQYFGVLPVTIGADPIAPAYDRSTNSWGNTMLFSQGNNPARITSEQKYQRWDQHKLVSNLWTEIELAKNLSFRTNFSNDLSFDHSKNYYPQFSIPESTESRSVSLLTESRGQSWNWNWSNYFTYAKSINNHNINLMLGQEAYATNWNSFNVNANNVPADANYQYISASKEVNFVAGSSQGRTTLLSYFGRINYSFKGKYLLTATGRYDGSSRFTKANRWGFFPSFAAAWNIMNESFMDNTPVLSTFKLRAGYGKVGNQSVIGPNDFVTTITTQQRYSFNGVPVQGQIATTLSNPELKWESSNMSNFALDLGAFEDRLNFTAEYFIKDTKDMLVTVPIPEYVGAYAPRANAGTMRNSGYEFNLTYKGQTGSFNYDLGLNSSFIKNELISLGGGQSYEGGGVNKVGNTTRVEEGMPFPFFYGYKTDGIFNTSEELSAYVNADNQSLQPNASVGDVKFVDTNGDGKIDASDRVNLGNPYPKFTAGLSINLEYKGFDLKAFLYASYGNKVVNSLIRWNELPTGVLNSTHNRLERWTAENPNSNEPRMTLADANNNMRFSDRYVEDGSFVKLRNIQLGYTLPSTLTKSVGLRSVRIYISSDNLLRWTKYKGYDPEIFVSSYYNNNLTYTGVDLANYPQAKTIIGGVNITF